MNPRIFLYIHLLSLNMPVFSIQTCDSALSITYIIHYSSDNITTNIQSKQVNLLIVHSSQIGEVLVNNYIIT